jgi:hypothetical protein
MGSIVRFLGVFAVVCNFASYTRADEAAPAVSVPVDTPPPIAADAPPPAVDAPPLIAPPPAVVVPPPLIAPPLSRQLLLATGEEGDRVARAHAMRNAGISVFAVGVVTTIISQFLLGNYIVKDSNLCFETGCKTPPQSQLDAAARPYRSSAIATVVVGNAMIATGLTLWCVGNGRGRRKARSVGALSFAPSSDGRGAQGGVVVHF